MKESYKIAIIVPAYNVEKYIAQCLESLINQTYSDLEIIVVDDGSQDNTLSITQSFALKDSRIQVIHKENQGVSEARNSALENVTAEFVMFVDGDDWLEGNTCEVAMAEMIKEKADVVCFAYIREYEQKSLKKGAFAEEKLQFIGDDVRKKIHRRYFGPYEKDELAHPEKLDALSPVWGKVYNKNILQKKKFISLKVIGASGEDTFYNIDVFKDVEKVIYIKKNLYHYRKDNLNSITKKVEADLWQKCQKSYLFMQEKIKELKLGEDYVQAAKNRFAIDIIAIGLKIMRAGNSKKEKCQMIKDILYDPTYQEVVTNLDTSSMPIHWKVFFWNVKKKNFVMVYLLFIIILQLSSKI